MLKICWKSCSSLFFIRWSLASSMRVMLRLWESRSGIVWHWSNGEGREQCRQQLQWIKVKGGTGSRWGQLMVSLLGLHIQHSLCWSQKSLRQTNTTSCVTYLPVPPQWHVRDSVLLHSAAHYPNLCFFFFFKWVYDSCVSAADSTLDSGIGSTVYSDSHSSQQSVLYQSLLEPVAMATQQVCIRSIYTQVDHVHLGLFKYTMKTWAFVHMALEQILVFWPCAHQSSSTQSCFSHVFMCKQVWWSLLFLDCY